MKKKVTQMLKAALPALLLWSPALASSVRSVSRLRGKGTACRHIQERRGAESVGARRGGDPFAVFGESLEMAGADGPSTPQDVLGFLAQEGLLAASAEKGSLVSGELTLGRKPFAGYCTNASYNGSKTSCTSMSYTWVDAPAITRAVATHITATGFDLDVEIGSAGTVYAVVVPIGSLRPTTQQIKEGKDSAGANAIASRSLVLSAGGLGGTLAFTGLPSGGKHMAFVATEDGAGQHPKPKPVDIVYDSGVVVDTTSWNYSELSVDSAGNFYAHYKLNADHTYYIKKWNGTGWSGYASYNSASIHKTRSLYDSTGMAVDGAGRVHVAFWDNREIAPYTYRYDLWHGVYDGDSWDVTKVSSDHTRVATRVKIAIDHNDFVHLTYETQSSRAIKYSTNAGGSWATQTVTSVGDDYHNVNNALLLVKKDNSVDIYYAKENGTVAQTRDTYVVNSKALGAGSLLLNATADNKPYHLISGCVDENGKSHLVYTTGTDSSAYQTDRSGSWVKTGLSGTVKDIFIQADTTYLLMQEGETHYVAYKKGGGEWADGLKLFVTNNASGRCHLRIASGQVMVVAEEPGAYDLFYHCGLLADYLSVSSNAAPFLTLASASAAYTENGPAVSIAPAATAGDTDGDADWDGGTLAVQITAHAEASDRLTIPDNAVGTLATSGTELRDGPTVIAALSAAQGTVTHGTPLTVTFNGNATNAQVQQVIRAVSYDNTSDNPGTSDRTVTFTLTDKNGGAASETCPLGVTAVNDGPTALSLSSAAVDENAPSGTVVGTFSVTDPDD